MSVFGNRYPQMVQEHYVQRVRRIHRDRLARRAKLKTKRDVLKLQDQLRRSIRECFGPLPERTPLNARVTGTLEVPGVAIEKVLFESRPGFVVTANLYIPKDLTHPAPCVLGVSGHDDPGKASRDNQSFLQGLARKGFVSMMFDPISQGERVQYPNAEGRCTQGLCEEHSGIGVQQSLAGEFFGSWRAWDGIRALDYLLSRPEVDAKRVGVTGCSGGGTMTTWLTGLDDRFTMSAPCCFIMPHLMNLENELGSDVEQMIPRLLEFGMDQYELFIPFAPRPLVILTAQNDFFDHRGSVEAYEGLRHIYRLLGAEDNIKLVTGPGGHGYARELREAMYGFFGKHAGVKLKAKEGDLSIQDERQLFATASGSTLKEGSRRVIDFTRDKALEVTAGRRKLSAKALAGALTERLALPARVGVVHHRAPIMWGLGPWRRALYGLETEEGIQAVVTLPLAEGTGHQVPPGKDCTLWVANEGCYKELAPGATDAELAAGHGRLFGLDVRGIGESASNACDGGVPADGCEYFYNSFSLLLGESYLGRRVYDVLCTLDWLAGNGYRNIRLMGKGYGALPALMAAVVYLNSPTSAATMPKAKIDKVTIINGLLSYRDLTDEPLYTWPCSAVLRGALLEFDLPDVYRSVGKKLSIKKPFDAKMQEIPAQEAKQRLTKMGLDPSVSGG